MAVENLKPIHPGEVLREEFLKQFGLSNEQLADNIHIDPKLAENLATEKTNITADIAMRLARFFGTSAQFWLGLQADYDLDVAQIKFGKQVEKEIVPLAA